MTTDRRIDLPDAPAAEQLLAALRRLSLPLAHGRLRKDRKPWRVDVGLEGGTAEVWLYEDGIYVTTKRQPPEVEEAASRLAASLAKEFGGE